MQNIIIKLADVMDRLDPRPYELVRFQMVDDNQKKPNQAEHEQKQELHQELPIDSQDPFFRALHRIIRFAIRILAVLMVAVIVGCGYSAHGYCSKSYRTGFRDIDTNVSTWDCRDHTGIRDYILAVEAEQSGSWMA